MLLLSLLTQNLSELVQFKNSIVLDQIFIELNVNV